MNVNLTGDWKKAGIVLKALEEKLPEHAQEKLYECGEMLLDALKGHIERQDLPWIPKKDGGLVYIDTGYLKDNLAIRKIKSSVKGSTIFVGASPWKTHKPSGLKMSDLMTILEYGRRDGRIPARPLIRPTWNEMEDKIKKEMAKIGVEIIKV